MVYEEYDITRGCPQCGGDLMLQYRGDDEKTPTILLFSMNCSVCAFHGVQKINLLEFRTPSTPGFSGGSNAANPCEPSH